MRARSWRPSTLGGGATTSAGFLPQQACPICSLPQSPIEVLQTIAGVNLKQSLADAIARFGKDAEARLSSPSVTGEPEDQLRAPFEQLVRDMAALCGLASDAAVTSGESSVATLHTRPDYAITANGALVGFAKVKAPGKGADPRRMKGAH